MLPISDMIACYCIRRENGGERGIRTPEGLSPADLQSESFGQLGYLTTPSKDRIKWANLPQVKLLI